MEKMLETLAFIELIRNLVLFVFVSACINSCTVAGFLKSIKRIKDIKDSGKVALPNWIGVVLTYFFAFFFVILLGSFSGLELTIISIIILGFVTGCLSILVYESAIKALLDLIPTLYERFMKKEE